MLLKKASDLSLSIHTYLVIDEKTRQAAVVDPTRNVEPLLTFLANEGIQLTHILETHIHADFVSGSKELKQRLEDKPSIVCSGLGGKEWQPHYADRLIMHDREVIELGDLSIQAWHVPGHTPEHLMWVIFEQNAPIAALTGDFLLGGSLGRPDLLGQEKCLELTKQLYHSVFHVLKILPDHMVVYPGHGAGSFCGKNIADKSPIILAEEKQSNPYLKPQSEKEWIQQLLANMPSPPRYFSRLKQLNVRGADLIASLPLPKAFTIQELQNQDFFLVDLRHQGIFAQSFIKGSVNIPFGPSFTKWAGEMIPADASLAFISPDAETVDKALQNVHLVGLDRVAGFFLWEENLIPSVVKDSFELLSPEDVQVSEALQVIDVRTQEEWNQGHILGALHLPLPSLLKEISKLSTAKNIVMICGSGYRSSIAASFAKKGGFARVASLKGGMQAFQKIIKKRI